KAVGHDAATASGAELQLFAWRYSSLSPAQELRNIAAAENAQVTNEDNPTDPDRRYAWERKILEERKLISLVVLPDYVGLAANVRDWQASGWGEWHLADVWLDTTVPQKKSATTADRSTGARP